MKKDCKKNNDFFLKGTGIWLWYQIDIIQYRNQLQIQIKRKN